MGSETPRVVVFAEKELHPFYRAFAAGLGPAKILTCREGPGWAREGQADLVLIDCGFSIRLGLDLLKRIKKSSPGTMVVIITERSYEDAVIEAFRAGARYYLRKPVSLSGLRRISMGLLKLKGEAREERSAFVEKGKSLEAAHGEIVSGRPANLLRAVGFIEENLGHPLNLEICAREANLSKFQFCRAFQRHFGVSPMRFVNILRICRAQELLSRNDLNITEIAMNVGFREHGSFTKAFKKQTGQLPSEFRNSLRGSPKV
jgi:AraC-like DNA-binding protein